MYLGFTFPKRIHMLTGSFCIRSAFSRVEFSPAARQWEAFGGCESGDASAEKADPIGKIVAGEFPSSGEKQSGREGNNLDSVASPPDLLPVVPPQREPLPVLVGFSFRCLWWGGLLAM